MTGAKELFQSKRFWTMLISIGVALALHFIGKYGPQFLPDVQYIIDLVTPLAIVLIAAFTVSDVAANWFSTMQNMHAATMVTLRANAQVMDTKAHGE